MTVKTRVLEILLRNQTRAVSGQNMADSLSVSRNAVWKAIEELRAEGYDISAVPRQGYQLMNRSQALDAAQIRQLLNSYWKNLQIITEQTVTSTNDLAKARFIDYPPQPLLVIANEQTKGRGRRGRSFHSQLDHGLYFSLGFQPGQIPLEEVAVYSLLAVTAIALALEDYLEDKIAIKWVNDLFYRGRKVSGILSEVVTDLESSNISNIVIGIGINLAGDFSSAPTEIQEVAGTVFGEELPETFNQNDLLASFLTHFENFQKKLPDKSFLKDYNQRLLGRNKTIHYFENQQPHQGIIRGLNQQGNLLVETPEGKIKSLVGQEIHFSSRQFLDKEDECHENN